jgi:ferredoxin
MALRHLKIVRVAVSLAVFVVAVAVYLDLAGALPGWLSTLLGKTQLVPSVLRMSDGAASGVVATVVIVGATFLFGRVYCSSLCPLGTLQDFISRLNRERGSRRRFVFQRQSYLLHYGLSGLVALLAAGGSMLLLNLTEPFSNFGRATTTFARPVAVLVNNLLAGLAGGFHVYALSPATLHFPPPGVFLVPVLFLGTIGVMSYRRGRLFCNTLCPAGALLGIISRFSLYKIVIDESTCKDCGLCAKVCKTGCIDSEHHRVDFAACVSCFNCLDACPTVGLTYAGFGREPGKGAVPPVNKKRRAVLRELTAGMALIPFLPGDSVKTKLPVPTGRTRSTLPVTPPGSVGIEHFTARCTACHLCVSACPTQVLAPSLFDYGLDGMFQPRMDYSVGTCNYDCTLCGEICPDGAILPLARAEKQLVQMGKAKFIKDDCIVVTKKTDCGACSEHCPTKAVHMVKYEAGLVIPEVNDELCVGCGACEHPCPTAPNKAIYVEANPVHLTAKKPETKKAEPAPTSNEAFPF